MEIFYNDTKLDVQVNDNSYRYRAIKGEHNLTLYFSLPQHVEIPVGAWCIFENETYTLERPENFKMHNSRNFEYTVIFESSQAKAKKYKFRNPVDRRLKFNLTATPREHLQMFVDNMNMRDSGWTIGQCIDAPEKLISYNHALCMDVLSQQATEFETEYEFNGKEVSLWKVEYNKDNPLPLSYGRGNGFKPGVGRTNFNDSKPVEVLFVQGGEQNIDASKYKSKELLLPKNQTLRYDGKSFEGQAGFNASVARTYISDANGFSIKRQDKPLRSKEEGSLDLSHVYPSRVGEVTAVEVTKEGFCDFFDSTIPENLDFSLPESRFKGETMTVIFQSGMLAGKEFEIQQNDNTVFGYIHSERRFKVVEQTIDGEPMPKGSYMPVVGDKYAVFGIVLPEAYICDNTTKTGGSWDMFREAAKYLYENEEQKFTFTGELDGIWAKKDWLNIGGHIKLGGYILFSDAQFQPEGVGIRIVGIKDYINNPHSPEIELSNSVVGSSIMSDIRKIESNEVLTDSQHKDSLQFTKRRFRDAQQSTEMLENALLDFTNSVSPVTVKTMQLLLGDASLQYQFVESKTNPEPVNHQVTYDDTTKILTAQAGILQHLTMGIDLMSPSPEESDYKFWDIDMFNSPTLIESSMSYYLYVRVSKLNSTGIFYLSETAIEMDSVTEYYHLLYGTLSAEFEGVRSFVLWYGYAELTPGRFTIPKIVSPDGKTYFDVAKGEIGGNIVFVDKDGNKKTLISGGKIVNDAVDTGTLFVNNIITKPISEDDKRHIEITSASNSMVMYNAENNPCLIVHGTNYQSIQDIIGLVPIDPAAFGSASFEMGWKYPEEVVWWNRKMAEFSLCSFSITSENTYTMTVPPLRIKNTGATTGTLDYFDDNISITLDLYKDGYPMQEIYYNRVYWYGSPLDEDIITSSIVVPELGVGIYEIKVRYEGDYFMSGYPSQSPSPGPGFKLVSTIKTATPNDPVVIAVLSQVTKMFANGFASTWSSNKYFSIINKDTVGGDLIDAQGFMRFMSENGSYGLRQTDHGLLVTDNGVDPDPNWFGMMPGLVHAGLVRSGNAARRWSAPGAGRWSSEKNNNLVGNYLVNFRDTPFTSGDDFTILLTNISENRHASVFGQWEGGFNVLTADDATLNDSDFCFFVFNIKKWL